MKLFPHWATKVRKLGALRLAGLCSGSNVAWFCAISLVRCLGLSKSVVCENLFDVECNPQKRKWLQSLHEHPEAPRNAQGTCIFKDIVGFGKSSTSACCVHEGKAGGCDIPTGPDGPLLSHCGFSCKSFSPQNKNRKQFTDAIATGNGSSGATFNGLLSYAHLAGPPVLLMENVVEILSKDATNNNTLLKHFRDLGYCIDYCILQADEQYVPQKRKRVYYIALKLDRFNISREDGDRLVRMMVDKVKLMSCSQGRPSKLRR